MMKTMTIILKGEEKELELLLEEIANRATIEQQNEGKKISIETTHGEIVAELKEDEYKGISVKAFEEHVAYVESNPEKDGVQITTYQTLDDEPIYNYILDDLSLPLPLQVGDFHCVDGARTIQDIKNQVASIMEKYDEEYFESMAEADSYEDIPTYFNLIHYDYADGGIGSVSLDLKPLKDEDNDIELVYAIVVEYEGGSDTVNTIVLNDETEIIPALKEAMLHATKQFPQYMNIKETLNSK